MTLLQNLDRNLFEITLVLMRCEGELLGEVPPDVRLLTLETKSLWRAWFPLIEVLKWQAPDIVFSTSSGMNVAVALAHRMARSTSRLVLSERGLLRLELGVRKHLLAFAKRLLYGGADCLTAVSREVARELHERLRVPTNKIKLIHNPIVDDKLTESASEPLDHPWFSDGVPIVLSAGRLVPEKDHATMIDAFSLVRAQRPARLVVLGDGPLRAELEERVTAAALDADIHFVGFDSNPFRYMSRCSVFALSSTSEGLPGVLIQAMACGAPVVSTDCPSGPREIISPDETGILVPVGNPEALAAAISALLENPETADRLARRGVEEARRFSIDETLPDYQTALLGESSDSTVR